MKAVLLLILASLFCQARPFLCAIKAKQGSRSIAPTIADPRVLIDGVLQTYLPQTMIPDNQMTVIGMDTSKLDYQKPYVLILKAQSGIQVTHIKFKFTKNTGLVVHTYSESTERFFTYEFMEATSSVPAITVTQKNGWSATISCHPN